MHTIYCSGPLFSPEERAGMQALARVVEQAGYRTFLPHRDGLESVLLRFAGSPLARLSGSARQVADRAIFALDVYQLVELSACLVFNMNGRVPDEGAAAEAAIAFAVGKAVLLYKQDARGAFDGRDNSMLLALSPVPPVGRLDAIPGALAGLDLEAAASAHGPLPPRLRRAVDQGRRIDGWLRRMPFGRLAEADDETVLDELIALDESER